MCRSMWTGSWRTSMATHLYAATMSSTSQHRSDASPYIMWTYFPKIQQAISDSDSSFLLYMSIEFRYICYPWQQKHLWNHWSCFSPIHVISVMFQQLKKTDCWNFILQWRIFRHNGHEYGGKAGCHCEQGRPAQVLQETSQGTGIITSASDPLLEYGSGLLYVFGCPNVRFRSFWIQLIFMSWSLYR
jgi:hypothetical protein